MTLYCSPDSQTSFEFNIKFEDGGQLGFPIRTVYATFALQITSILPMQWSFEWVGLSVLEKKFKIDNQHGGYGNHLGFLTGTILLFLIYKSPRYFLQSFESFGISVQTKFNIDFQDGGAWISNWNNFCYFWSTSHHVTSFVVSRQLAFQFKRRSSIEIFKMAAVAVI